MGYRTLELRREGRAAVLVLNRPERLNAFDRAMREELPRAWEEIAEDPGIWVAVVTGAGERAFCAGMDLREPRPAEGDRAEGRVRITNMDCGVGKPVIAAVNGVCAGGGLAFVADADLVVCSESASFTDGRTSAGQVSIHGTLRLARKIPLEAVFRLVLLGRGERLGAERALQLGLAGEVVPPERLLPRALELAQAVARNSPAAVFHSRDAIWRSLDSGLDRALEQGWEVVRHFAEAYPDAAEGARAFVERREPRWQYAPPPGRSRKPEGG